VLFSYFAQGDSRIGRIRLGSWYAERQQSVSNDPNLKMLLKSKTLLIGSIFTLGISTIVSTNAARADFFRDINNNINNIRGTQKNANDTAGNVTNILGIGQPSNSSNNSTTNINPISLPTTNDNSNSKAGDANTQLSEGYFAWYSSLTPSDREIVKELTKKYAEDKSMTFADFAKTKYYKGKNDAAKSQASAVFFKFKETIDAVGPQKSKFLAYAFCVNGGGKDCK
jgi:hypothetical protein